MPAQQFLVTKRFPSRTPVGRLLKVAVLIAAGLALAGPASSGRGEDGFSLDRCELVPLPGHQVSLRIDGREKARWHYGEQYPRPFFYPLAGPSGATLTRMGHPGAQNHDHHRSIWFAHNKVNGIDFWSDNTDARIRQNHWYSYRDGDDEAILATSLGWYDGEGRELMQQDLVAALLPMERGEHALEIQITMRPGGREESVQLEQTNFGFLAVRVAKTLSAHFGGGRITDSEGRQGEPEIFGKQARWMDYSGPVAVGRGAERRAVTEGITYFDHPDNPRYPTYWHVRQDGWMGASFGMREATTIRAEQPLTLRYLLHAHGGPYDAQRAAAVHAEFAKRPGFEITKATRPNRQYEVARKPR